VGKEAARGWALSGEVRNPLPANLLPMETEQYNNAHARLTDGPAV